MTIANSLLFPSFIGDYRRGLYPLGLSPSQESSSPSLGAIKDSLLWPSFIGDYRRGLYPLGLSPKGASVAPPLIPLYPPTRRRPPRLKESLRLTANAILYFRKKSVTEFVTDPYTGNVEQVVIGGAPVIVYAAVREVKRSLKEEKTQGLASNQVPLRGYILSPPSSFASFDLSDQIEMEVVDGSIGSKSRGLIDIIGTTSPHNARIEEVSGLPFTGIFSRIGSGETPEA